MKKMYRHLTDFADFNNYNYFGIKHYQNTEEKYVLYAFIFGSLALSIFNCYCYCYLNYRYTF